MSSPVKLFPPSPFVLPPMPPLGVFEKLLARALLDGRAKELESRRPCCKSCLATSDCSRRSSLSRYCETRERREETSGCISERRADWADWREGSEMSSKCCYYPLAID